jgi:Ca2+-binding EF-hand superfamily protein
VTSLSTAKEENDRLFTKTTPIPSPPKHKNDNRNSKEENHMDSSFRKKERSQHGKGGRGKRTYSSSSSSSSSGDSSSSGSESSVDSNDGQKYSECNAEEYVERGSRTFRERRMERQRKQQQKRERQQSKTPKATMADELPTEVTRMVLTVLFERFDRNGDASIDVDEFQRLISSCNMRRNKRRRPAKEDVLPLLQALDVDGDGRLQIDEFEGWVTKGFNMSLKQLEIFASKGTTEAMLVDFLLSLRADVKGVMRRITSTVRRYSQSGESTDVDDRNNYELNSTQFAMMSNSCTKSKEETVTISEISYFLKSNNRRNNIQVTDITSIYCRSIINLGLSIQGRGQQKNRRVWVLVRRKGNVEGYFFHWTSIRTLLYNISNFLIFYCIIIIQQDYF